MTVADGRGRNGRAGLAMVGLNGVSNDRSRRDHPSTPHDWIPELSLAADPPTSPRDQARDANVAWPPATVSSWPVVAEDELAIERSRLEAEIAAAKARTLAARHHDSVMRVALHAEVVASQKALTEMERQHEATVAVIRETARDEAARILSEARQHVAHRRGSASCPDPDPESGNHAQ